MYKQICKAYKAEEDRYWEPSEDLTNKVINLIRNDQKILAVKTLMDSRENSHWHLKDCVDMKNFLERRGFC